MTAIDRTAAWLFTPVSNASLRVFRVVFGLLMTFGALRFFVHGWIEELYVLPTRHFTYTGFAWVQPWSSLGMRLHVAAMGVAALFVASGIRYRASLAIFLALFAYVELLDKTTYLNHYYLVTILAAMMLFMPLGGDAPSAPRWMVLVLRIQVGLVYFFAGIAKLKPDWLFAAQPLRIWLAASTDVPLIGPLLGVPGAPWLASWFGAAMDLTAPLFLSIRRTRPWMFAIVVVFHLVTGALFNLGLFPWIMIAAASLFFPPDWPLRIGLLSRARETPRMPRSKGRYSAPRITAASVLAAHFVFQLAWPLRHHLYDGDVTWNENGFRFSWNVMLVEKTGYVVYEVRDPGTGRTWLVYPHDDLTPLQLKMMATQPDLLLQYAHWIARDFAKIGYANIEVRADSWVSRNGRPARPFLDPKADLTKIEDSGPRWWVLE